MTTRLILTVSTCFSLLACSQQLSSTEPRHASTGLEAPAYAGMLRGSELMTANLCGVSTAKVQQLAATSTPSYKDEASVEAYRKAVVSGVANPGVAIDRPTPAACADLLSRPEFGGAEPPSRSVAPVKVAAPVKVPASPATEPGPSYCATGSIKLKLDASLSAGLDALRADCRPGDSLIIPSDATGVIASACDLSKPVAAAGPNVFCTMGRIRSMRPPGG